MRPSGFKSVGILALDGSSPSSAPDEVSATPPASTIPGIDCLEASWAICSMFCTNDPASYAFTAFGQFSDGGGLSQSTVFFNQAILKASYGENNAVSPLPEGAFGVTSGALTGGALSNITEAQGFGGVVPGVNMLLNIQGAKPTLTAKDDTNTGELVTYEHYYAQPGVKSAGTGRIAATGPVVVAIPCGCFERLNFEYINASGTACDAVVAVNLIY
mgnify:FL=1